MQSREREGDAGGRLSYQTESGNKVFSDGTFSPLFCAGCWNEATIFHDGTPLCRVHARAAEVI